MPSSLRVDIAQPRFRKQNIEYSRERKSCRQNRVPFQPFHTTDTRDCPASWSTRKPAFLMDLTCDVPRLKLLKNRQRRLLSGHDWVFSNELDPESLRGQQLDSGRLVHLHDHRGKFLASAFYNPATLIAGRVVDRRPLPQFSSGLLGQRLEFARTVREQIYEMPHYRWVHGESDRLPGLVIDRFGSVVSVQITSSGMEGLRAELTKILLEDDSIEGVIFQDDLEFRKIEGLPVGIPELVGNVPEFLEIREGSLSFRVPATGGQKTGWFFDQRDNRMRLHRHVRGKSFADLYCYAGAWGIHAAHCHASQVTCLDSSAAAIATTQENAKRNECTVGTIQADAISVLKEWAREGRKFDVVLIDPPALIKRRKDMEAGLQAYYQLNRLAVRVVNPGGLLISCSCSHHLPEAELISVVNHAAWSDDGRSAAILEIGTQSSDHPVHPAMPETRYLKALFVRLG